MIFKLGLIGYPLGHSLSPKIHAAALEACGLEGDYALFPIPPDDRQALKALLTRLRTGELHGLNVTIPHKQTVIPLLDELTPTAQAIGAVNTIFIQNGQLTGDNTDAPGFLADLKRFLGIGNWKLGDNDDQFTIENRQSSITNRKSALVLGAGGSARAVVYALLKDGWNVTLTARRIEQARELAASFPAFDIQIASRREFIFHLSSFHLLVNTTPLGMSPNTGDSPWPADLPFPQNAAVYDLVYNPRQTKLVREARAAGLPAVTGLGMLVEQAALSFEIWTECAPARDVLYKAVDGD